MDTNTTVLVTGASGGTGNVGRTVVDLLRQQDIPVRALVHHLDERAEPLRSMGAEVVVGDLTHPDDVARALDGVERMFFGMSVSPSYLEATATVATVARATAHLEALLAISQMTVSQMTAMSTNESHHQRLHWLSEQVLNWSGLRVVIIRPTVFLDNPLFMSLAAASIRSDRTLALPFGTGRTSPIAADDVAAVAATVLSDPGRHIGKVYELTGPRAEDMNGVAAEYSHALGETISYRDIPADAWEKQLSGTALDAHLREHILTMARLHRQNRYDRMTYTVQDITGHPARTVEEFVTEHATVFS